MCYALNILNVLTKIGLRDKIILKIKLNYAGKGKGGIALEKQQYFQEPVVSVITRRSSVRNYQKEPVSDELKIKINNFLKENQQGPLGNRVRLFLLDNQEIIEKTGGKIGTYGVIKGATTYIGAAVEKKEDALVDLGYVMEKVILYCTSLGLGTCWLGGTLKRSGFAQAAGLKENEILPAVTPVGYSTGRKGVVDRLIRAAAGSSQRKAWEELFFYKNLTEPLDKQQAGIFSEALEMVRLGPSASNKQPWRIVMEEGKLHFYLQAAKGYGKGLGFSIQKIDVGIAMCHLEMTLKESGIEGIWNITSTREDIQANGDISYIISFIQNMVD